VGDKSNLIDLTASYVMGDLSLGLNADYSKLTDKNAYGLATTAKTRKSGGALYANYQVTKEFRAGLRGEYLKKKYLETASSAFDYDQKQSEVTLTGGYSFSKNFDLLGEVRHDNSKYSGAYTGDVGGFVDNAANTKNGNTTMVVKAIYKF